MSENTILPASDRRSPFHINVPAHDSKPITELVAYFKHWKHFVGALIAYLKDLLLAKEFQSNLNLQLIGSVQFPGYKDLPYKSQSSLEQRLPSPTGSQIATPKNEPNKQLGSQLTATTTNDSTRPGLTKTKSSSSFLKNQTFAHRKTNSFSSLKTDSSGNLSSTQPKTSASSKSTPKQTGNSNLAMAVSAAKIASKSDVSIEPSFFPPDSLFNNMSACLINEHFSAYLAQSKTCRDISQRLVPKLESLHKNIGIKIKEIKSSLKNESFANPTLVKEISKTGVCLNNFVKSVNRYSAAQPLLKQSHDDEDEDDASMTDPFLVKLALDYQLKNQLIHENYIFASYVNLQNISKDLFNYVVKDLNSVTDRLIRNFSSEAVYASSVEGCVFNLGVTLRDKLKSSDHDWQYFIVHNPNFLNNYYDSEESPKKEIRSFKDIIVPYANSVHSKCLRCGYMYKKQKLLKSYVSYFYLLTCNYLHEFKIDSSAEKVKNSTQNNGGKKKSKGKVGGVVDHNDTPIKSYNLNNYFISVKSENELKFVLTKTSNPSQKFTFKCQSNSDFVAWSTDLHDLLKFSSNHLRRFKFIEMKMQNRESGKNSKTLTEHDSKAVQSNLDLGKILPANASLKKIQPSSLNGIFTPKVQSPSEQDNNPFEDGFNRGLPSGTTTPNSETFSSPTSENNTTSPDTQDTMLKPNDSSDYESYLKLQNEIMFQQQQLLKLDQVSKSQPSLSRESSNDSVTSVLEPNNSNLTQFLNKNHDFVKAIGENAPSNESLVSVPSVHVSSHESC